MNKFDEMVISAKTRAMVIGGKIKDSLTSKEHGDSQLVVALVLIAVALGLCLLFRTQIKNIMTNLFTTITNQINNLSAEPGA